MTVGVPYAMLSCTHCPGIVLVPRNEAYSSTVCGGMWKTVVVWSGPVTIRRPMLDCNESFKNPLNLNVHCVGGIGAP